MVGLGAGADERNADPRVRGLERGLLAVEADPDVQARRIVRQLFDELDDLLAGRRVEQEAAVALGVLLGRQAQAEVILAQAGEVVGVERETGGFARGDGALEHRERAGLLLHVEGDVGQVGATTVDIAAI